MQAVDREWTAGRQPRHQRWIGRDAELRSGGPQHGAANAGIDETRRIVAVAKRDAAVAIPGMGREADGVVTDRLPEERRAARAGSFGPQPDHAAGVGRSERAEIIGSGRRAALGNEHVAIAIEQDFRNFGTGRDTCRHEDFDAGVGSERSIGRKPDRPDARARGDGVVEPAAMNREPEHPARRQCGAPGCRIFAVEGRALNVEPPARVKRNRRQANHAERPRAVVEASALAAIETEAMDRAG